MTCVSLIVGLIAFGPIDPLPHLGSYTEQLRGPARLAVAPDDSIYVSDPLNGHIVRFDALGAIMGTWPIPQRPVGIAVHPDGRVFVSLRDEPKVAIHDTAFNLLGYLGADDPLVTFVGPTDIDIATDTGTIYVVDADGDRIYGFQSDGSLALILGMRGSSPSQFLYPSTIAVDEVYQRLIVADHDSFRVQMFTTSGVFIQQFGDRLTPPGTGVEGWMPRPAGLAVDLAGRVYLTDALMSTVRLFDPIGEDLGKLLEYGSDPGELRAPCDVALSNDGSRLYVVSSNSSSVEVYDATAALTESGVPSPSPAPITRPRATKPRTRAGGRAAKTLGDAVANFFGTGRVTDASMGNPSFELTQEWDGPHIVEDRPDICWPCHGNTGQPGAHGGTVEGQTALCTSCHNAGGRALRKAINERDLADPFGTHPTAADGRGRSHAWGVPAVNALADSVGPTLGGAMAPYVDGDGNMKCTTCHNQHSSSAGAPYLRMSNEADAMCKECHAPRDQGPGDGGSHAVGFAYPAGAGEYPLLSELGTPFIKAGMVECMTCHGVHGADSGGANDGDGDGMLLRAANDGPLCEDCHTQHVNHGVTGDWQPACLDCHDVHDPESENVTLVARDIFGTPVTFTDGSAACNGQSDFVHSECTPPTYDGVCEVCHTTTAFHLNTPAGDHTHHTGIRCTVCHPHASGFLPTAESCSTCHGEPPNGTVFPNRTRSHATHFTAANGPHITECTTCHASPDEASHMNGVPSFASGVDIDADGNISLAEADVCDTCHSNGGAFDGVNDPVYGAKANWADGVYDGTVLKPGKQNWCAGCHDTEGAVIHSVTAPAVGGDNKTWGFNLAGHGLNEVMCTDCHDPTLSHMDGIAKTFSVRFPLSPGGYPHTPLEQQIDVQAYNLGYRLRLIDGMRALETPRYSAEYTASQFRLCFNCHDEVKLLGVPENYHVQAALPPHLILPPGVAQTNYRSELDWGNLWEGGPSNTHWKHVGFFGAIIWDIDHDTFADSVVTCTTCHNPHGAQNRQGGLTIAMTAADLEIRHRVYDDGTTLYEYGYIGSDAFFEPGGDLHCFTCHPYSGAGANPPDIYDPLQTRFYREWLDLP